MKVEPQEPLPQDPTIEHHTAGPSLLFSRNRIRGYHCTTDPHNHVEHVRTHQRGATRYLDSPSPAPWPFTYPITPHCILTPSPLAKVDSLCNAIFDERSIDPHGGNGYLSTILRTAKPHDTSEFSQIEQLDEARDYYTSAQKELTIREQTAGLVRHCT